MSFVERVSEAGRYGDGWGGNGLSLLVKPRARGGWRKTFTQRLMLPETGKTVNLVVRNVCNDWLIGTGAFPAMPGFWRQPLGSPAFPPVISRMLVY